MVIDEAWVEVKSKGGKTYFWNRCSNSCSWALPASVVAKWTSHKSAEGRTYYYDRDGSVVWVMPPLQAATSKEGIVKVSPVQPPSLAKSSVLDVGVGSAESETLAVAVRKAGISPSSSEPEVIPVMKVAMELSSTETPAILAPKAAIDSLSTEFETPVLRIPVVQATEIAGILHKLKEAVPEALSEPETPVACPLPPLRRMKLAKKAEGTRDCEKVCEHQPQDCFPGHSQPCRNTIADVKSFRGRSRSPRRGLSPDAKLKLARKIAALKQGSAPAERCPLNKSAPRSKLQQSVFEFPQHRQASTGGA